MVSLVIAAHGHLAEGLVASSAMIVGPSDDVVAVTFESSEGPDDLLAKYAAAVEGSPSQEHLILVDLFGGSPYNAAARFAAGRDDADVVTGVNLPMIIEVLSRRLTGGRPHRARGGRADVRHGRHQGPLRDLHPHIHHHFRR